LWLFFTHKLNNDKEHFFIYLSNLGNNNTTNSSNGLESNHTSPIIDTPTIQINQSTSQNESNSSQTNTTSPSNDQ
ncbi:MAG: hypothetical protein ACMXYC_04670, partial [Candidatus Woesearchaeota archaeon]